jgi:DNA-binding CsgD family transcriptional regulator
MAADWPLVGRDGELRQIRKLLTGREYRGLVLAGPAGVGKTRLAVEGLELGRRAGLATARVTATRAAAGLPFGALAPLLPALHHPEPGAVDARADFLRRSAAALVERAGGRRLVLLVDDAHLLDDASATLAHQLAATDAAFVLATVRTDEPVPDPILALWKDAIAHRLEIAGLKVEAVEELLCSSLGGPVDRATAAHLAIRCQGNVLFLRELVLGAVEDGTLREDAGIWHLAGPLSPSQRLVELVEARLVGLNPAQRDLLELVSFGEPLGPAELGAMADVALASGLERRGLLTSREDGRRLEIRLAHPVYGDVVRARIPALRTRAIARALAEAVEATGARRREDLLRVATWRLDGGGLHPVVMMAAATTARWRYDFPLAERLARAAIEAGAEFDAALLAAQLAGLQGRGGEAEAELATLARAAADDTQRGLVALARLENSALYLGLVEEGIRVAEEAEAAITDQAWRDEIAARRASLLNGVQGPKAAADVVEPLLLRAEGRGLAFACLAAALCLARLGRLGAALQATIDGYSAQLQVARPLDWYPWTHVWGRCYALAQFGRFKEADALATVQYEQGLADQSAEARAWFAWHQSRFVTDRGHVETAIRYGREAVQLFRELGRPQWVQFTLTDLALALAVAGRADEAIHALSDLDALGLPRTFYMGVELPIARAWVAVASGDLVAGRGLFEEAAAEGERIGDVVGVAASLHSLARIGFAKEAAPRLVAVVGEVEGHLAPLRAAHAVALAAGDAQELHRLSAAFEAMDAILLAAEAAAAAALAYRAGGDARKAASAEHRARTMSDVCTGAATPALQAIATRGRLTPAEREVAQRAAAGRTNKEIAEELFLSVRTVENHLHGVYTKLGISGRSELGEAMD